MARPRRLFGHIDIPAICYFYLLKRYYRRLIIMGVNGTCYVDISFIEPCTSSRRLIKTFGCLCERCLVELVMSRCLQRFSRRHLPSVALSNRTIAFLGRSDLNVDDDERAGLRPLATMSRRQSRIPVDTRQNDTLLEFENCESIALPFDLPTNTRQSRRSFSSPTSTLQSISTRFVP